ncbi:MAG TPA: hypothetical protein HA261_14430 [Methanosarcina sp.]|nr:hypothetical protein [Methanosarcina sp.]
MDEYKKLYTVFALLVITSISFILPVTAEENNSITIDQEDSFNWAEPPDNLPERVSSDPKDEGLPGVKYINTSKYRSDSLPYKQISAVKFPYEIRFEEVSNDSIFSLSKSEYSEIYTYPFRIENPQININSTHICIVANQSNQINQNSSKNINYFLSIEQMFCPALEHIHLRNNMSVKS